MICPKCGSGLRKEQSYSGSCGLLRQDGGSGSLLVSGFTCWKCGYWRDAEVVPVLGDVLVGDVPKRVYDPAEKTAVYHIVSRFFESITLQRKEGVSWYTIAKLLSQGGHRCQERTLQKYFILEQRKRCSDEKTV